MGNGKQSVFFLMFLFAFLGLWQFSDGVRSVDIVGLFASGALKGAAVTGFLVTRNRKS